MVDKPPTSCYSDVQKAGQLNRALKSMIVLKFQTQDDFAARLGVSRSVVSNVVQDRHKLSFEQRMLWAKVLECIVTDIFPELEQDKNPSTHFDSQKGVIY